LQFAVCSLQFAVCSLQFAVCSLQFAVCSLQFAVNDDVFLGVRWSTDFFGCSRQARTFPCLKNETWAPEICTWKEDSASGWLCDGEGRKTISTVDCKLRTVYAILDRGADLYVISMAIFIEAVLFSAHRGEDAQTRNKTGTGNGMATGVVVACADAVFADAAMRVALEFAPESLFG